MNRCDQCQFWVVFSDNNGTAGNCQRKSPVLVDRSWVRGENERIVEISTEWPVTMAQDGCGDWEHRRGVVDQVYQQRDQA